MALPIRRPRSAEHSHLNDASIWHASLGPSRGWPPTPRRWRFSVRFRTAYRSISQQAYSFDIAIHVQPNKERRSRERAQSMRLKMKMAALLAILHYLVADGDLAPPHPAGGTWSKSTQQLSSALVLGRTFCLSRRGRFWLRWAAGTGA